MRILRNLILMTLSFGLAACAGGTDLQDGSEVAFATFNLEAEDGGFDLSSPDLSDFEDADPDTFAEEGEAIDEPEIDAEIRRMADFDRYEIRLMWGRQQLTPNSPPTDWSGAVSTDLGAIRVLRTLRFEGNDTLLERTSKQSVEFESRTTAHNDGLRLRLVVPRSPNGNTGVLTIRLGDRIDVSIPHARLTHLIRADKVDDLGNGFAIVAFRSSSCAQGGVAGHWTRLNDRGGVFAGKVQNSDGELKGRIAGIWGIRENGTKRFYGLFIQDGEPAGLVRGTWKKFPNKAGGVFRGHYVGNDGEHRGVLRGFYKTADANGAGRFMGLWLGEGCNVSDSRPVADGPDATDAPDLCSTDGVCVTEPVIDCDGENCVDTTDADEAGE